MKGGIQAGYLQYAIINTEKEKGIVIHVIIYRIITRGLYSEGHMYEGKFAWQNRLGLYWDRNLRLKIYWASLKLEKKIYVGTLHDVFTETRREDVYFS